MKIIYFLAVFTYINVFSTNLQLDSHQMNYNRILKIIRMGNPILRMKAAEVADISSTEIKSIIKDMKSTFEDLGNTAVGLAAPQINIPLQIIVIHIPEIEKENFQGFPLTIMINLKYRPLSEEKISDFEECLSIPDLRGLVPRYKDIAFSYINEEGKKIESEAHGFFARVIQHEYDHLIGKLYLDRIEDFSNFGFAKEMREQTPQ